MRIPLWTALSLFAATQATAAPLPRTMTADHTLTMTGIHHVDPTAVKSLPLPRTLNADQPLTMTGQRNLASGPVSAVALPRTLTADQTLTMTGVRTLVRPRPVPVMKLPPLKPRP